MPRPTETKTKSITDAVNEAFELIAEVKDEVQETYDNLSERAQEGERGEFLSDLIATLEAHSEPDVEEFIGSEDIQYVPNNKTTKKAKRDLAVTLLDNTCAVIEMLEADEERDWSEDEREALVSLRDELETVKSDWEGIEFSR